MDGLARQMQWIGGMVARRSEARGGVLLHAALMEWQGRGVILAGPGGRGKTTASRRLPASWNTLSDDLALVVRDPKGRYFAHPWPTWSRFMWGGSGDAWDVQHAVPLRGLFFLDRAETDAVEPLGPGHAVTLLVEAAEQAALELNGGMKREALRRARIQRFESRCALASAMPAYVLRLSLHGDYWRLLEQLLD
jgi:SynChlorMet cassette protein ScmC